MSQTEPEPADARPPAPETRGGEDVDWANAKPGQPLPVKQPPREEHHEYHKIKDAQLASDVTLDSGYTNPWEEISELHT